MHEQERTRNQPPAGGIFLPQEPWPEWLQQRTDQLETIRLDAEKATRALNEIFYDSEANAPAGRTVQSPLAAYQQLLERTVSKQKAGDAIVEGVLPRILYTEDLMVRANEYNDIRAAITAHGEAMAYEVKEQLPIGYYELGNQTYQIRLLDDKKLFCTPGKHEVYFNYWENIKDPDARAARLEDYIGLLDNLARAPVTIQPAAYRPLFNRPPHPSRNEQHWANKAFAYAYCFWLQYGDVLQPGLDLVATLTDDAGTTELYFESGGKGVANFTWQVRQKRTDQMRMVLSTYTVTPDTLTANRELYVSEGITESEWVSPEAATMSVVELVENIWTKEALNRRLYECDQQMIKDWEAAARQRKRLAFCRSELGIFALTCVMRPGYSSYWKAGPENDYRSPLDLERHIMESVTEFMRPPKPPSASRAPIWDEAAKQAFLVKMAELRRKTGSR